MGAKEDAGYQLKQERAVTQSKRPAEGQTVAYPCEASVTEEPVSPLSVKPPRGNSGGGGQEGKCAFLTAAPCGSGQLAAEWFV